MRRCDFVRRCQASGAHLHWLDIYWVILGAPKFSVNCHFSSQRICRFSAIYLRKDVSWKLRWYPSKQWWEAKLANMFFPRCRRSLRLHVAPHNRQGGEGERYVDMSEFLLVEILMKSVEFDGIRAFPKQRSVVCDVFMIHSQFQQFVFALALFWPQWPGAAWFRFAGNDDWWPIRKWKNIKGHQSDMYSLTQMLRFIQMELPHFGGDFPLVGRNGFFSYSE